MRVLLSVIAVGRIAMACSCGPQAYAPLCQRIEALKVLFIGTAVETNDHHDGFIRHGLWYRFKVEELFKGLEPGTKEVIVDPASGTSCQDEFTVGKRYLVSSYGDTLAGQPVMAMTVGGFPSSQGPARPPGPLVVAGECSGSQLAEYAQDDIHFIRQYFSAPGPAKVFGTVRIHADEWLWDDRHPALRGAALRLTGPSGTLSTATDENGRYEIPNILPGKYELTASFPGLSSARPGYALDVPAHGCGFANIGMFADGSISGTVLNQEGAPVAGVAVEYFYSDTKLANPWFRERSATSDAVGKFRFTKVPPGDYLVGVHIDTPPSAEERIPPTYWPGVTDIAKAQVVHLALNEQREGIAIKLGPRAGLRQVTVTVRWPNGRPSPGTNVAASVNGKIAELKKTNPDGTVQISLLEGVKYSFSSRAFTSSRDVNGSQIPDDYVDAGEIVLPAGSGPAEISLLLNKPRPKR